MKKVYLIVLSFLLAISACNVNNIDVDVSGIKHTTTIKRFEKDLFKIDPRVLSQTNFDHQSIDSEPIAIDSGQVLSVIMELDSAYGSYFELYNNRIISLGGFYNKTYADNLSLFLTNYTELYLLCEDYFGDLAGTETSINNAFKHYKYYFPDKKTPEVYTHISGFNQSIVVAQDILSISLDKYLGSESEYYQRLAWPVYLRKRMERHMIPFDCMYAWASTEFEMDETRENLSDYMIYNGKLMYFMDAMFPEEPDSIKIGYSSNDIEWCNNSEADMWLFLIDQKKLFTTDYEEIRKYVGEAPFTATFSQDSPGRTGIWIGWQIIRSYMQNHPEVTLPQLMNDNDYSQILNSSKYNP